MGGAGSFGRRRRGTGSGSGVDSGSGSAEGAGEGTSAPERRRRPEPTPGQRAMGLLVRREHSRKELARKLEARGVDGDEAAATVARMAEAGWQDDARFATGLARSRALAGYGPLRIRAELSTHGLGQDLVQAAFDALSESGDDDWRTMARGLVERRHGAGVVDDPALRRKAADFLFRRGFDGDTVRAATAFDFDDA
ncbi:regulatory protein RecX [Luteimonas sp. MC1782]|nr:regulatory protein RecX [Luteimonas sp. MC1895]